MELLQPRVKREVAAKIVGALLAGGTRVGSLEQVEMLFRWGEGRGHVAGRRQGGRMA
jgi:hypothetical protein